MPRWLFFVLLAFGVAIGVYLRRRNMDQQSADASATDALPPDYGPLDSPVGQLPDGEPGLAGAGVISPPGGVYPVNSPYIPEGLTEIIGTLTGGLVDVVTAEPAQLPSAVDQPVDVAPPPAIPATGGGPPKPRPHTVPKSPPPRPTRARYVSRQRAISKRHGKRSPELRRFRQRHPSGKA